MSSSRAWEERLEGGARREAWVRAAYAVAAATGALFLYLGIRPGGAGPILAYGAGRTVLFLLAAGTLLFGLVASVRRRPVLQRGRLGALLASGAAVWLCAFPLAYPSSFEGRPSAVRFRLPFDGAGLPENAAWTVRWGGGRGPQSALALLPDRRFGFDFVVCDAEGRSDDGARDLCRGLPVLAPAAGTVVRAHDGEPDAALGERPAGADPHGNHVVIEVAPGEHLFVIGLEQGSVAVRAGDRVEAGAPLGRVGASARSSASPLAFLGVHLQAGATPRRAEGIPFEIRDYATARAGPGGAGERFEPVEKGVPLGGLRGGRHVGERVRPLAPGAGSAEAPR